jgi:hypothetical protein
MPVLMLPAVVACALLAGAGAGDAQPALDAAMGPYYAALVATARGNIEASQRQLLLFESAWQAVVRHGRAGAPAALANDPAWDRVLARGSAAIKEAGEHIKRRDVAAAHSDLEGIRLALREIRGSHHLLTFDDYLTDFHEGMERAVGHVGARNEIVLRAKDYDDIREDVAAARDAWRLALAAAGRFAGQPGWPAAARLITSALDEADRAAAHQAAEATARAVAALKEQYYDLLLVLSRLPRP